MATSTSKSIVHKTLTFKVMLWLACVVLSCTLCTGAYAVSCGPQVVKGTYVLTLPEFRTSQSTPQTFGFFSPASTVGTFLFDGRQNVSRSVLVSVGGEITTVADDGTYVINADCSGSISFQTDAETYDLVVIDSNSAAITDSTIGDSGVGTLTKTRVQDCSAGELHGTYVFYSTGLLTFDPIPRTVDEFFPIAVTGTLSFDGQGNSARSVVLNFGGMSLPYEDTGSYQLDRNCTGTAYFASDAESLKLFLVDQKSIAVAVAKAGGVGTGTLVRRTASQIF